MLRSTPILMLAFVLCWNSGFIAAEFALAAAAAWTITFWRYWAAATLLALKAAARGGLRWPGIRPLGFTMAIGTLSHGVWLVCVLLALERGTPPGIVALVVALQPLLTGALSGPVTGEQTPPTQWLGLILGFLGVCMVLFFRIDFTDAESVFAYLIPLGSVLAITLASLLQRWAELRHRELILAPDENLLYQSLGTALFVTVPAVWLEGLATEWSGPFIAALLWLIVVVSIGAYGLMWRLLARTSAARVAALFYLGPPVTMVMAWLAFGDSLRRTDLIGLAIVAVGIALTSVQSRPKTRS